MLTVGQILPLIRNADILQIAYDGMARSINPDDELEVEAYSKFCVKSIYIAEGKWVDLIVATTPLKMEEAAQG